MDVFIYRLQFIFASILIFVSIILLSLLLVVGKNVITGEPIQAKNSSYSSSFGSGVLGAPNAVTTSIVEMSRGFIRAAGIAGDITWGALRSVASTSVRVTKAVTHNIAKGFTFIIQVPSKTFGALMTPTTSAQVPVIEPHTTAALTGISTLPQIQMASSSPEPRAVMESAWPIHGRITTLFGVPHRPYQVTHTGMDIASGQPSGITMVKPFLPGRVIDTVRSTYGLGNHVIVDHGAGMTSVYAHLYSISVQNGQEVGSDTTLGYEGSTGVSTGTHLHFEIRLNGISVNPQEYVGGRP